MTTETAITPVGGPGGLAQRSSALSDRLRVDLAAALLDSDDPERFKDAAALLADIMRHGKSQRARVRAAALLLTHAERVAEWSLPKAPAVQVQAQGQVILRFESRLPEGEAL